MATPTAGKHVSQQAVATPPVSTPFSTSNHHPAFSPHGPRSVVPSPQQVKKSPANSNTLYGYPSGGGHPTNSSFGGVYDSPSAAMALGVPDLGLEGMGASGLGAIGSMTGRSNDDDRQRKLQQVLDILKTNKGRLSEPGVERLAKRYGLDAFWQGQISTGGNTGTLLIAGTAVALDVDFKDDAVEKVALSFPDSPEIVTKHAGKAESILLGDLQFGPNESALTKMLDKFAANLERLATLDKLSGPGLNCHEAIAGIYESLERLHKWELSRLAEQKDILGKDADILARTAMCTKSGEPVMHARGRIGLSLDYWEEKRRISRSSSKEEEQKRWSLLIGCSSSLGMVYPPVRVSDKWISANIVKPHAQDEDIFMQPAGPILDWQQPENTVLPHTDHDKPNAMEGIEQSANPKYPEVMFMAKFDPPLVVPYAVAMEIYGHTGAPLDPYQTSTFDELCFPPGPNEKIEPGEPRKVRRQTTTPVFSKEGQRSTATHANTLFIEKIDYGRKLTELPFSHPSQLIEIIPSLRQYALLSTLLKTTFGLDVPTTSQTKQEKDEDPSNRDQFAAFMSDSSDSNTPGLPVDVSLTTQPVPRLQLVFPFKDRTANITFDIKLNGVVEVVSENILNNQQTNGEVSGGKGRALTKGDLSKMLEITEDLGIWTEFVRRRLG
ncbi:mediator of RNA polymerase II transcription subunit 1-domain-containing protein [Xylogone sp. PMI_703]|nr:mediator of RNA polymerase II transcription subunit 1-domain-containing protein [Xylogone sp. PMI_703]